MNVRNQSPFPDMRDPTTGEWLPSSYSSAKRFQQEQSQAKASKSQMNNYAKLLLSVLK